MSPTDAQTYATILRQEAADLIARNQKDAVQLGEQMVKNILAEQILVIQPVADLLPDATAEQIADREEVLKLISEKRQLIAKAEAQHGESIARVRADAAATAGRVTGVIAGLGLSAFKLFVAG